MVEFPEYSARAYAELRNCMLVELGAAQRVFLVPREGRLSGGSGKQDGKVYFAARNQMLGGGEMRGFLVQLRQMS